MSTGHQQGSASALRLIQQAECDVSSAHTSFVCDVSWIKIYNLCAIGKWKECIFKEIPIFYYLAFSCYSLLKILTPHLFAPPCISQFPNLLRFTFALGYCLGACTVTICWNPTPLPFWVISCCMLLMEFWLFKGCWWPLVPEKIWVIKYFCTYLAVRQFREAQKSDQKHSSEFVCTEIDWRLCLWGWLPRRKVGSLGLRWEGGAGERHGIPSIFGGSHKGSHWQVPHECKEAEEQLRLGHVTTTHTFGLLEPH